jgi:hypothetical protein
LNESRNPHGFGESEAAFDQQFYIALVCETRGRAAVACRVRTGHQQAAGLYESHFELLFLFQHGRIRPWPWPGARAEVAGLRFG